MFVVPENKSSDSLFWMSSKAKDEKGREANAAVIAAAQKVFSAAVCHCQRRTGDPSPAHDLMERAIFSVSGFIQRYGASAINSSLEGLVLAAFDQQLNHYAQRENRCISLDDMEGWQEKFTVDSTQEVFCLLQMEQLLEYVPEEVGVIFRMLYENYTAEEIGSVLGLSSESIRAQVCYWRRKIKGLENNTKSRLKKWRKLGAQ
jgi:DNA-directed RNA polymerase specialized sigma24 family protein